MDCTDMIHLADSLFPDEPHESLAHAMAGWWVVTEGTLREAH